jgi:hypothetical protein
MVHQTRSYQVESAKVTEKTHIIFLAETEEATNLGGALRAQSLWVNGVSDSGNVAVALLDNAESKNSEVHADDAATDGLALAFTSAAGAIAGVSLREQQANTSGMHNTLFHRKALLVVAASDFEDVAFEFVAQRVRWNFLAHSSIHEDAELAFVFDFDHLLGAIGWEGDVELHLDCGLSRLKRRSVGTMVVEVEAA